MSIMGLDVGDVRIGIAISEDLLFAHPLKTIERIGLKKDIQHLCQIVMEKDVETIVVGLPKRLNGEIGIQAEKVQGFSRKLEKKTKAKIVFWDERLKTVGSLSFGVAKVPSNHSNFVSTKLSSGNMSE